MTKKRELERRIAELKREIELLKTRIKLLEICKGYEPVPYYPPYPLVPPYPPGFIWTDDRTDRDMPTIYPKVTWKSLDVGSANVVPVSWYDSGASGAMPKHEWTGKVS